MKDRKEEILNYQDSTFPNEMGMPLSTVIYSAALKAMEQYAEEMAVGFANYILNDISKSFYGSQVTLTTNNDYYQQYLESIPQPSK